METKWLEDFISLAETHSFSRSAELRHVTQPAFSRRIQSLEAWLGADLIDRTAYPTRLTEAGVVFYEQAVEMLGPDHQCARPVARQPADCTDHRRFRRTAYFVADLYPEMAEPGRTEFRRIAIRA